jgi:hypothetical protein
MLAAAGAAHVFGDLSQPDEVLRLLLGTLPVAASH